MDAYPAPPSIIATEVRTDPLGVRIIFQEPNYTNCSSITRYKLYQSSKENFNDEYLGGDYLLSNLETVGEFKYIDLDQPQVATPYFFKIAAINSMGEGSKSQPSSETIIGNFRFK